MEKLPTCVSTPQILLTGFSDIEKVNLIRIVNKLNANYLFDSANPQAFVPSCTHVIAKKVCRSEKFMCACASGKWILVQRYLTDSEKAEMWLKEDEYEWGLQGLQGNTDTMLDDYSYQLLQAPSRWRIALKRKSELHKRPFHGWNVGIETDSHKAVFNRLRMLIESGGGKAYSVPEHDDQYTIIIIHEGVDYRKKLMKYHRRGMPCVPSEYIARFLIEQRVPPAASCSVFGPPVLSPSATSDDEDLSLANQQPSESAVVHDLVRPCPPPDHCDRHNSNRTEVCAEPAHDRAIYDDESARQEIADLLSCVVSRVCDVVASETSVVRPAVTALASSDAAAATDEDKNTVDDAVSRSSAMSERVAVADEAPKDVAQIGRHGAEELIAQSVVAKLLADTVTSVDDAAARESVRASVAALEQPETDLRKAERNLFSAIVTSHDDGDDDEIESSGIGDLSLFYGFTTAADAESDSDDDDVASSRFGEVTSSVDVSRRERASSLDDDRVSCRVTSSSSVRVESDAHDDERARLPSCEIVTSSEDACATKAEADDDSEDDSDRVTSSSQDEEAATARVVSFNLKPVSVKLSRLDDAVVRSKLSAAQRRGGFSASGDNFDANFVTPDRFQARLRSALRRVNSTASRDDGDDQYGFDSLTLSPRRGDEYDVTRIGREFRRFNRREMIALEGFVQASHPPSLFHMCDMLLSKTAYPPPELLYLYMRKFVLEAVSRKMARIALEFLDATLCLHPPSAPHIRHDHVYLQAMSIQSISSSALLCVLGLRDRTLLWNEQLTCAPSWEFFSSAVSKALRGGGLSRHNAVILLTFLSRLAVRDAKVVRRLLSWRKRSSGARHKHQLQQLCALLREASELCLQSPRRAAGFDRMEFATANTQQHASNDDATVAAESEDEAVCFADGECDDDDEACLNAKIVDCLCAVVTAVVSFIAKQEQEKDKQRDLLMVGEVLAEEFATADERTLDLLLVSLSHVRQLIPVVGNSILKRNCAPHLASPDEQVKTVHEHAFGSRDLLSLVIHYLRFVPHLVKRKKKNKSHVADDNNEFDEWMSDEAQVAMIDAAYKQPKRARRSSRESQVNKRNHKGETALHRACIQNRVDRVAQLLLTPGIDPNSPDHVGWTPLGEACDLGHLECVRELLRLPLAPAHTPDRGSTSGEVPPYCIDLTACPQAEAKTPLHDAISHGYVEIARALMMKGGVTMLYTPNNLGETPLDMCGSDDLTNLMVQIACEIASQQIADPISEPHDVAKTSNDDSVRKSFALLAPDEAYKKVVPSVSSSHQFQQWLDACRCYVTVVRHLLFAYVQRHRLMRIRRAMTTGTGAESATSPTSSDAAEDGDAETDDDRGPAPKRARSSGATLATRGGGGGDSSCDERTAKDVVTICNWHVVTGAFREHVRRLVRDDAHQVQVDFELFSLSSASP